MNTVVAVKLLLELEALADTCKADQYAAENTALEGIKKALEVCRGATTPADAVIAVGICCASFSRELSRITQRALDAERSK